MRFTLLSLWMLLLPVMGGNFNVVHLAGEKELTIEVTCDKRTQSFTLQSGEDSGTFAMPDKAAVFSVKDNELKELKADANDAGRMVLLYQKEKKLHWHMVTSQAVKDKTSLRLINLTDQAVGLAVGDTRHELSSGQDLDAGVLEKNSVSITLDGQKAKTVKAEEPTAYVAVIYPSAQGPQVRFIADR